MTKAGEARGLALRSMQRHMDAMGSRAYDVAILDRSADTMQRRLNWAPEQVLHAIDWLRYENQQGRDAFIRPCVSALVLVDDLDLQLVRRLDSLGLAPALVVETSPANHQAWIRVSDCAQPPALRRVIAARLAAELETDRGCAGLDHYGRLAGLTNRKPEHAEPAPPFAKVLLSRPGTVALRGAALVHRALADLAAHFPVGPAKPSSQRDAWRAPTRPTRDWPADPDGRPQTLADWIALAHRDARARFAQRYDASIVDFQAALAMIACGVPATDIIETIGAHSPDIARRKGRQAMAYARRSVERALERTRAP
ncbi:MAG: DNA-primase RepB domain-containing protein [Betaproteobacteria bacterium]|nr:DNA-primase RepB domain-containing protein [Betaproteobacteria bacterium]